ncbi:diphthine--ammonia ligase [archaeon]|jgi:diphthine-ammonia ligase|nr:diphthine--ammonia ligase [archaeon]MBT4373482.1 diphthine--ammonia ligase [archaeon]MBT4531930.1 diphthine--ammonia ligase [archaeon]MBT7001597.1 diphthine--ammonia ligase [archaeon]MBT7282511.1 diphthine--ammonia ligase [archaeon]
MKLASLLSGGKDSVYAIYLAKKAGHKIQCAISIASENPDSFMFHTPSIEKTKAQAKSMQIPLIIQKTKGKKEIELKDLEKAIKSAKLKYKIEGVITGAIKSVYQSSRIQKICDKLNLKVFNPLWQKNEEEYLKELIKNKFKVIITSVAAYSLDQTWLGRKIDKKFIQDTKQLNEKYKIHVAGEGGEFETFVLNCPLFKKELKIKSFKDYGEKNSWRREIELE